MLKLVIWLMIIGGSFAAGYWAGQRPVSELKAAVADLSRRMVERTSELTRQAMDTTHGVEKRLRVKKSIVEAKDGLVQAKSQLLDRNYGQSATALTTVLESLQPAAEQLPAADAERLHLLLGKVRGLQKQLAAGKAIAKGKLDEVQQELGAIGDAQ